MKLLVRPAAAGDIEAAAVWYETQRRGLGDEFLDAVTAAAEALLEAPQRCRVVHRDTRRAHVPRFPYSLFYRVIGDHLVIVGCFHGSRDPRRWEGRR